MAPSITARNLVLIAAAVIGLPGCSDPEGPVVVTAVAIAASNGQSAMVGSALPQPLQVRVLSHGAPKAGVTVRWRASDGSIAPASSRTDAAGIAAATWILGDDPGVMIANATVAGAQGSPVRFSATALSFMTVTLDPASDHQIGVAGTVLQSLRVTVDSDGAVKAGVTVTWRVPSGSIAPVSSRTNAAGVAKATWTLGTVAGEQLAYASVVGGAQGSPLYFSATAVPGPVSAIHKLDGDAQTTPANHRFRGLIVSVTDQYGNGIAGQSVTWTVESGPVALAAIGGATDGLGRTTTEVTSTGTSGAAVVRAALSGGSGSVDFALTVGPPAPWAVTLNTNFGAFSSAQNGSNPAVDTIPAGGTVVWTATPFDYAGHSVISVGTPSFQSAEFPYADPEAVSVTFTTPGTYHYTDSYYSQATGTVLVQ